LKEEGRSSDGFERKHERGGAHAFFLGTDEAGESDADKRGTARKIRHGKKGAV